MKKNLVKVKDKIKSFRKSLAKLLFDKRRRGNKILETEKASGILFLRNDNKIGDMVISTLLFREFKKRYPDIKVTVLCGHDNKEIIKHNPYIDEAVELPNSFFKKLSVYGYLRKKKIDIAVDFFPFRPRPGHMFMLRRINPGFLIGFYKKSYNMYDFSFEDNFFNKHISERYVRLLNLFKINPVSLQYELYLEQKDEERVLKLTEKSAGKFKIVINPFAASVHRTLSYDKLKQLIDGIKHCANCHIYVLVFGDYASKFNALASDDVFIFDSKSVLESAALVKYCDLVISPDTSIVHAAAAFKRKLIALYLDYSGQDEKIDKIWSPNYDKAVQISVDTQNGAVKNDINSISNDLIIKKIKEMIEK